MRLSYVNKCIGTLEMKVKNSENLEVEPVHSAHSISQQSVEHTKLEVYILAILWKNKCLMFKLL